MAREPRFSSARRAFLVLAGIPVCLMLVAQSALATPGERLWVKRYNGPGNDNDIAESLAVSPDGSRVFVTGGSTGSTSDYDYATVAYDASTGAKLWASRYNGPGNGYDLAQSLAVSPDGSKVFVTGASTGSTSGEDYATVAYDASTGSQVWATVWSGPGNHEDAAWALGVSPDGSRVFVTGSSVGSTSGYDYVTVTFNASTGSRLWTRRYMGPGNGDDFAYALGVSPNGAKVFVTGSSTGSTSGQDYATVAYAVSTGSQLWAKRYNGTGSHPDIAWALGVSPDGSTVLVTGQSRGSTSGDDYATVAYDASTGSKLWATRYNGPVNFEDAAYALGVSPDGSTVLVTGSSYGSNSGEDYVTVAYDASTGSQLWAERYNGTGSGDDFAYALGVSPDGSTVFVTGQSRGSYDDYATVAYDASTGSKLWRKRYSGPGTSDGAFALGVSPDGFKVFVTGYSVGSTSYYDYATVTYSTS